MSVIDVDNLLQEITPDAPCGEDLEYDPQFGEMERSAQIKPEQQFGDTIIPAEEPDWREVKRLALDVLGRSKDMRAAMYLARALVRTDGFAGLADSLALLAGYIERYWEPVHPHLDPDDNNDPTIRINAITTLCDRDMMLTGVLNAPLVSSRAVGSFTLRDVRVAEGTMQPLSAEDTPPSMATIEAAFSEVSIDDLQETANQVTRIIESANAIDAALMSSVGASQAPDLAEFQTLIKDVLKVLAHQLQRRGATVDGAIAEADAGGDTGASAAAVSVPGAINGPDDVVKALERICEYYHRQEPSSPVPLLLKRAQRLVSKGFMEILQDLIPDNVSQAGHVVGLKDEQ